MTPAKVTFLALLLAIVSLHPVVGQDEKKDEKPAEKKKEEKAEKVISIFPDKNLEAVVRRTVFAKRDSDEPLTAKDVEKISNRNFIIYFISRWRRHLFNQIPGRQLG